MTANQQLQVQLGESSSTAVQASPAAVLVQHNQLAVSNMPAVADKLEVVTLQDFRTHRTKLHLGKDREYNEILTDLLVTM